MEKLKQRSSKYEISLRRKNNGYYEARTTFKLGGGNSNRLERGGKTDEAAVLNLLTTLADYIKTSFQNGLINTKIDDIVKQRLVSSINDLCLNMPEITQKILEIINIIDSVNAQILNKVYLPSNVLSFTNAQNNMSDISISQQQLVLLTNNLGDTSQKQEENNYRIDEVAIQWKKYELELCVKSDENPNPLCQKTIDGYIELLNEIILPFFKKNRLSYIKQINTSIIKELIKSINGYQGKRNAYIVLSLFYKYLIKQEITSNNIMEKIEKPIEPEKNEEEEISCIEPENQQEYIDMFEKENTDMSLLFETMLLTGIRPEEACGLKWTALRYEIKNGVKKYELVINNAYKDFNVYDDNGYKIGHERRDDKLKTSASYRTLPLNTIFAERLLEHKEKQKKLFKTSRAIKNKNRKWSETEYMFIGRTYRPYVSDTLSSAMPKLCDKYKMERITPYTLRHSFATFCYEKGMKELVLMKLMGHSSFETTHKYYIRVTKKVKEREMAEVYDDVFYDRLAS